VDFELSEDQVALQQELRRFLAARVGSEARRAIGAQPGAVDRGLWGELAGMGVFSLTVAEADGGVGLGMAEAAIAFEELGRAAVPGPLISTFLAVASGWVDGDAVVGWVPASGAVMIEHLDALDSVLVVGDDGVSLAAPPSGLTAVARPLDPLTPVHLIDTAPSGDVVGDTTAVARVQRDGELLAAAMQVGLGAAAVDLGAAYAGERTQFGKVIGGFQAVKHLLADAQVAVEVARAAVHAAAVEIDEAEGAAPAPMRAVDGARIVASHAAERATTACIQVHGGIGYTWELDAHLLLKRAMVLDVAFTTVDAATESLAAAL